MKWEVECWGASSSYKTFFISSQIFSKISLQLFLKKLPWNSFMKYESGFHNSWFYACACYIRGGTKSWILKPQVNFNVTPIYKNGGKRIFVFSIHLDPPHWPSNFENHHYRVKNQNCRRPLEWPIKTSAREALGQWKKLELNRTYQFGEKSQKPSKNAHIYMWEGFGGFFGFFSELVSPIEL